MGGRNTIGYASLCICRKCIQMNALWVSISFQNCTISEHKEMIVTWYCLPKVFLFHWLIGKNYIKQGGICLLISTYLDKLWAVVGSSSSRFDFLYCQILSHIFNFLSQSCILKIKRMKWRDMKLGVFMEPYWCVLFTFYVSMLAG